MTDVTGDIRPDPEHLGRKHLQVTEAARRLFMQHGFSGTSTDAIAREAGVSKATLYSYYSSKEVLFGQLVSEECAAIQADLTPPSLKGGLVQGLRDFAHVYVGLFSHKREKSMCRIMANESTRFPDLCWQFYEMGPLATTRRLAQFLLDARQAGFIEFDDAMIAASQFLSLIRGDLPLLAMLSLEIASSAEREVEIEAGLRTFLRAYGVKDCGATGA